VSDDKPTEQPSDSADATEGKKPFKERFMEFVQEYGPIAVITWFTIFFSTWGAFIVLLNAGVDLGGWLSSGDGSGFFGKFLKTGGVTALAYGATQVVKPIRIAATFAITPAIHNVWEKVRGRKPESESEGDS